MKKIIITSRRARKRKKTTSQTEGQKRNELIPTHRELTQNPTLTVEKQKI
jgi:hypothetical protein